MLTVRGVFKDGRIDVVEEVTVTGEHQILIIFLDDIAGAAARPTHKRTSRSGHKRDSHPHLSRREVAVLKMAQQGMKSQEIAEATGSSDGSVRNCLSGIYTKLRARNRTEALKKAVELGVLDPTGRP